MAKRVKAENDVSPDEDFMQAVGAAALRWLTETGKIADRRADVVDVDHINSVMEIGPRFLKYMKGEADFVRIGEHGPFEPATCGTSYLTAERVLRIVENGVRLGDVPSADALTYLEELADRAGVHFARLTLFDDGSPF